MKIVTRYVSDDGMEHCSAESCLSHEELCRRAAAATETLVQGATLSEALAIFGRPAPEPVFDFITKDTGIAVPHWQCRSEAGYHVLAIDYMRQVYLYGDAGSWSGPYGNWISLRDLARHALDTKSIAEAMRGGE